MILPRAPQIYQLRDQDAIRRILERGLDDAVRRLLALEAAPQIGFRTFIGSWGLPNSELGNTPTPDLAITSNSGTSYVGAGQLIDDCRAGTALYPGGAAFFGRFPGTNAGFKNADGTLNKSMWKDKWDNFVDGPSGIRSVAGGEQKLRDAVADGTCRGGLFGDDYAAVDPNGAPADGGNGFTTQVTAADIEELCQWAKDPTFNTNGTALEWMPMGGRAPNTRHLTLIGAGNEYRWFDFGWAQARPGDSGPSATFVSDNVEDGIACGLGLVGGLNLTRGQRITGAETCAGVCWNGLCSGGGGDGDGWCGASPAEIEDYGQAFLDDDRVHGFVIYDANFEFDYWSDPDVQDAMNNNRLYAENLGRVDGPLNIRGDLPAA